MALRLILLYASDGVCLTAQVDNGEQNIYALVDKHGLSETEQRLLGRAFTMATQCLVEEGGALPTKEQIMTRAGELVHICFLTFSEAKRHSITPDRVLTLLTSSQ